MVHSGRTFSESSCTTTSP